jgi:hypothetical protein
MRIVALEIKKFISSYAILGFIILCLGFNALIIYDNGTDEYADYVANISKETGIHLGKDFNQKLASVSQGEFREWLTGETAEPQNVFDGYDTGEIAEAYIDALKLSGKIADDMRGKYADLQNVADRKAENGVTENTPGADFIRARFVEMTSTDEYRGIIPLHTLDNTVGYARNLSMLVVFAMLILLSPLLAFDRIRKVHQ